MKKKLQQAVTAVGSGIKAAGKALCSASNKQWAVALMATIAIATIAQPALAALPTPVDPGGGAASGDYMKLIQAYWKQGIALLVLIIGSIAFLVVGGGGIAKFNEYRLGKAEIGDLTMFAVLGVVLLVTAVYLLTTANTIID
jgi:integrating conjugative element membrane protein (TIGR03745 family)